MMDHGRDTEAFEGPPTAPTGDAAPPAKPAGAGAKARPRAALAPAILVTVIVFVIVATALWYLVQPQPLVIQGEADATRIDIAARVDGRVETRPVERGQNVAAGALLYTIDNPELVAKLAQAEAAKAAAVAELTRIEVGTRSEVLAQRKAAIETASANLTLAQKTYARVKELTADGHAPLQRLDEATNALQVAQRSVDQANLADQEAIAGYTKEERGVARASVANAQASVDTIKAQVDELTVKAPVAAQVYQIGAERGEYVSPGVALLSLIDLHDVWLRYDLREDLIKGLHVGQQFQMRVPALGDRLITAEIKVIATRGEYAGWRATRATGDFDLRTFEVRAYPVAPLPELRPGMSVYADWPGKTR